MNRAFALLLALIFLSSFSPPAAFSKGKKPPEPEKSEESQIQEEILFDENAAVKPKKEEPVEPSVQPKKEPAPEPKTETPSPYTESEEVTTEEEIQAPVPPQKVAQEPAAETPEGSVEHTVWIWQESKDCLWQLAKQYYKDPWQWKKIYLVNRNGILNPNVIFPKQKIIIPPKETQAQSR